MTVGVERGMRERHADRPDATRRTVPTTSVCPGSRRACGVSGAPPWKPAYSLTARWAQAQPSREGRRPWDRGCPIASRASPYSTAPSAPPGTGTVTRSSTRRPSRSVPQAASTFRTAWAANRSTRLVSGRVGVSQYQPQLANMASRTPAQP